MKHVLQLLAGVALVGAMTIALTGCGESTAPVNQRQPPAAKIKPPAPPAMGAGAVEGNKPSAPPKPN